MKPISPVVPGLEVYEQTFGAGQPQYDPLPCLRSDETNHYSVMSRWQLTPEERKAIADGADIYLTQLTFLHPYQPTALVVAGDQTPHAEQIKKEFGLDNELNQRLKLLS